MKLPLPQARSADQERPAAWHFVAAATYRGELDAVSALLELPLRHPSLMRLQQAVAAQPEVHIVLEPPELTQQRRAQQAAGSLRGRLEQQGRLRPGWHRRHGPELLGRLLEGQGCEPAADEATAAAAAAEERPEQARSDEDELSVRWLRYFTRVAANRALLPPHLEGQALPLLQHCFSGLPLALCAALLGWQARCKGFASWRSKDLHVDHEFSVALADTITEVPLVLSFVNVGMETKCAAASLAPYGAGMGWAGLLAQRSLQHTRPPAQTLPTPSCPPTPGRTT